MIHSGLQMAAARVLLGWTQQDLADAAHLHRRTIQYWEREVSIPQGRPREPIAVGRIRETLAEAGVEVFTSPSIGVRFARKSRATQCAQRTIPAHSLTPRSK